MIKREIIIPLGKQASRDLFSKITETTRKYESHMLIEMGNKTINAKSLLGLFALALRGLNQKTFIVIEGNDEQEAWENIREYIMEPNQSDM